MNCGETSKEAAAVLPGIPDIILASAIMATPLQESRAEIILAIWMFESQVLTPPDQPPRS